MIHKSLALQLPGGDIIDSPVKDTFSDLGGLLTSLLNIGFYVAMFIAFYYLVWGAFAYISAQGQKENLAKARARITWALIGLFVILLSFFIAKFASEILRPTSGGLPF